MPNFELLEQALRVLKLAQPERVNLDYVQCGSERCWVGWLSVHSDFMKLGLTQELKPGGVFWGLLWKGRETSYISGPAKMFELSFDEAEELFRPAAEYETESGYEICRKRLNRLRARYALSPL